MFRKSYWKKRFAPVLAGALVISSLLVPPGHAFAADPVTSEEQTVSPETPEVKDVTDSTDAATTDANLTTPDSVSDSVSDSVVGTSATDIRFLWHADGPLTRSRPKMTRRTRSRRIQIRRIQTNRILVHRMIRRILEAIILDRI